ncbi:hypothetical protein RHMOL_Rhmol06G0032600 [Rhododendron molle]|uniref:Uncharacterized protein n=1 Tax=Rhododendron molle TaxID=49168 RepID=A0ACC0N8E1_RHOML|nr:hypothetical protein RHMOL_Rhmol06G0032600 [Rhododendron molle]
MPLPSLSLQSTATSGGICCRRRTAGSGSVVEFALFSRDGTAAAVNGCFPASGEDWLRKSVACSSQKCWRAIS